MPHSSDSLRHLATIGMLSLLLAAWYILCRSELLPSVLVPAPATVLESALRIWHEGYKDTSLASHLGASMFRLLGSFALVVITAIPLGLASGYSRWVSAALDPLVEFYRPLPPLAYFTLLVIWLGIDNTSKFALLYLAGFAPVYVACSAGVRRVRLEYIQASRTLGANRWQTFRHVIAPACLPDIFTGLKTALGVAYTTLVAAEMVAAESGIGWMVLDASKFLSSDVVFVGIFIMGTTGVALIAGISLLEKWLVPWRGRD